MDVVIESFRGNLNPCRLRVIVRGAVQGVGFRPFIYRLAVEMQLSGWVNNSGQGVFIEVEGARNVLQEFLLRLPKEKPPRAFFHSVEPSWLDPAGYTAFEIRHSEAQGATTATILPDVATCADCLRDISDPANRRYQYPFTNCTNCGPRFSIIERLPYDRPNTSMKVFRMCAECQAEYDDPANRRFHAQPNACHLCGPTLELCDRSGKSLATGSECLPKVADAIREGRIVALKGLGGFQLLVAAHLDDAIKRLRQMKCREEKPFALLFPSLEAVKVSCDVSALEERLLSSPESPIVLLRRKQSVVRNVDNPSGVNLGVDAGLAEIAPSVAPGNPYLGVMLAYTPLHHLLLSALGVPVVATSGNLSDEPICIDNQEALQRLGGIADLFLCHNRPIVRHVDDSVIRIVAGRELMLRRARGYAPLPILLRSGEGKGPVLAVGAHLKNAVALQVGSQAFISQHIGDLETEKAYGAFMRVTEDLAQLYAALPGIIAADAHPDYLSTRFARNLVAGSQPRLVSVQHHLAHVLSCMVENELEPPVLGVSWDGAGYGSDGTVWGGEFIAVFESSWKRVAHLRPFALPGGDKAAREPRRVALSLLFEEYGDQAFEMTDLAPIQACSPLELKTFRSMLHRKVNCPTTTSMGRLFDAVAAICGLRQIAHFEGQAAMELEFAAGQDTSGAPYPFATIDPSQNPVASPRSVEVANGEDTLAPTPLVLEWGPMLRNVVHDARAGTPLEAIAMRFHLALVEMIVKVAKHVGIPKVILTGGCFQNRVLLETTPTLLEQEGFRPYWHQRVPPNDGGICLGQIVAALRENV